MRTFFTFLFISVLFVACNGEKSAKDVESTTKESIMSKKETVGAFLGAVITGDTVSMRQLARADYIQHNPFIPTGLEPFIDMLPVLQENGTTADNVRMFEDGDYVFMHNIWKNAKPFGADEMVGINGLC
jgi:predicted SnoaL-like aldol condensation-catalyzing enzyme